MTVKAKIKQVKETLFKVTAVRDRLKPNEFYSTETKGWNDF